MVEKFKHTTAEADSLVANLRRCAFIVAISGRSGWVTSDPDDDKFVDAALTANAEYIVSGDRHLLGLGSVAGVSVLRPREFLDRIRSDNS